MRCTHCPATSGPCIGETRPEICARAALPGQDGFRRGLARIAAAKAAPPSLAARAGYLASAVVAAVASGGETVSPEERARRLAICESCEHFDAAAERCRRCTCYMPLKTRLAAWHCPLDPPKW